MKPKQYVADDISSTCDYKKSFKKDLKYFLPKHLIYNTNKYAYVSKEWCGNKGYGMAKSRFQLWPSSVILTVFLFYCFQEGTHKFQKTIKYGIKSIKNTD